MPNEWFEQQLYDRALGAHGITSADELRKRIKAMAVKVRWAEGHATGQRAGSLGWSDTRLCTQKQLSSAWRCCFLSRMPLSETY